VDTYIRAFNPVDIYNQDHLEILLFYFKEKFAFIQELANFYKAEAEKFAQISDNSLENPLVDNSSNYDPGEGPSRPRVLNTSDKPELSDTSLNNDTSNKPELSETSLNNDTSDKPELSETFLNNEGSNARDAAELPFHGITDAELSEELNPVKKPKIDKGKGRANDDDT